MRSATAITDSDVQSEKDPSSPTTPLNVAIAFFITFFPLVIIATLLCLFVLLPDWTVYNPPQTNASLPIEPLGGSVFVTTVFSGKISLASSWASNIGQFAIAPFLLLFSFLVAYELANHHETSEEECDSAKQLLRGGKTSLFKWVINRARNRGAYAKGKGIRAAAIGVTIAFILMILLLLGDKLLQGTIGTSTRRIYFENSSPEDRSDASFILNAATCPDELPTPDIYQLDAPPPCSINSSANPQSILDSPTAYRVLETGLLNQTHDFNKEDFTALENAYQLGMFERMQLVTHIDNTTADQHVFFIDPFMAYEENITARPNQALLSNPSMDHIGIDYIAKTVSVVTKCFPITQECNMHNVTDRNTSSLTYHCSEIFAGDLDKEPINGLEHLKGWNTSFYNLDSGSPRAIGVSAALNPFTYNITAMVNSLSFDILEGVDDPQVTEGAIVNVNNDRVAFALSCQSSLYNVEYSLVNGSVWKFDATLADPREAAIVKAPLQVGFGSYCLFEKASMSVLYTELTVMDGMELSLSQTLLALAAGVYGSYPSLEERWRYDITVTTIAKAPFYFLVICLLLYALIVAVFTVFAFLMRRQDVLERQARLLPKADGSS